jgi:hypothetical protein
MRVIQIHRNFTKKVKEKNMLARNPLFFFLFLALYIYK